MPPSGMSHKAQVSMWTSTATGEPPTIVDVLVMPDSLANSVDNRLFSAAS
jgi:hypothetical protein